MACIKWQAWFNWWPIPVYRLWTPTLITRLNSRQITLFLGEWGEVLLVCTVLAATTQWRRDWPTTFSSGRQWFSTIWGLWERSGVRSGKLFCWLSVLITFFLIRRGRGGRNSEHSSVEWEGGVGAERYAASWYLIVVCGNNQG